VEQDAYFMLKLADEFVFREDHSNLLLANVQFQKERIPCSRLAFAQRPDVEFATQPRHDIAVAMRASGYQWGPKAGPPFQATAAPTMQTTRPISPPRHAAWVDQAKAVA
jgi:hypothetical protein